MAPRADKIVRKEPRYWADVGPVEIEIEDGFIIQAWPIDGTMGILAWKAGLGTTYIEHATSDDETENIQT